ncbi:response regulator [Flavobacterium cerinum]|uniref:Response regulator transcription factor n=1 Tax=Flavobacterium cerinum TaxID=2502784 RepID=A0A444HC96_9FLAO|nr:response regulator [Flavobacterium cerinum]RWX01398.1 response regulator transcription factor [Flavobacterium cerinum]
MNILLVDDHPMALDLYENVILENFKHLAPISITKALNCKDAYDAITTVKNNNTSFDFAILDYSLPVYKEKNILSGNDIANLIRKENHSCKIVIITSHTQILLVYDILKKTQPNGMAIKNDITASGLKKMLEKVLNGDLYQSELVKKYVKEIWKKELLAEETNRQILFYLSKGYKVKELDRVIALATSTIQRRIIDIKKTFNVSDDTSLIKEAIKQGFI